MRDKKALRNDCVTVAIQLQSSDNHELYFDKCVYATNDNQTLLVNCNNNGGVNSTLFKFDRVFDELEDQLGVYQETVEPLIVHAVNGYNTAIVWYNTNCNNNEKITLSANSTTKKRLSYNSSSWCLERALIDLWTHKESIEEHSSLRLTLSAIKLQGNEVVDLFSDGAKMLQLCETPESATVEGATVTEICSMIDITHCLETIQYSKEACQSKASSTITETYFLYFIDLYYNLTVADISTTITTTINATSMENNASLMSSLHLSNNNNNMLSSRDQPLKSFHSRLVFVDLIDAEFGEQSRANMSQEGSAELMSSTLSTLRLSIAALYKHSKHHPHKKCLLTKFLAPLFTEYNSHILLLAQVESTCDHTASTMRKLSFCNDIKKLEVEGDGHSEYDNAQVQHYLESLRKEEELLAELHILRVEYNFPSVNVHVESQMRDESVEETRERIIEELRSTLPSITTEREVQEMHELELQVARERDAQVESFVLHMNKLIEEYEHIAKSIKTHKKMLKKAKEENKLKDKKDGGISNDAEMNKQEEATLLHEAKKAKKTRLKLEAEVQRVKDEIAAIKPVAAVANANNQNSSNTKTSHYYDEDIDDSVHDAITTPTVAVIAASNTNTIINNSDNADMQNGDWEDRKDALVSSFYEGVTEVNRLQMLYVSRLLATARLRLQVKKLRVESSDVMTNGTLLADIIDFVITRAVRIGEKLEHLNTPWHWSDIDGRSVRLLNAQEMWPPLLIRNVTKIPGVDRISLTGTDETKLAHSKNVLCDEEAEGNSSELNSSNHKHHHHYKHHKYQGQQLQQEEQENNVCLDPVEYHMITFLSSDESDDENSHHAAESRRAGIYGNLASFSHFSVNEDEINDGGSEEENKRRGRKEEKKRAKKEKKQKEKEKKQKKKRQDNNYINNDDDDDGDDNSNEQNEGNEKNKHQHSRGESTAAGTEEEADVLKQDNFAPLSLQNQNFIGTNTNANSESQNETSNTLLDLIVPTANATATITNEKNNWVNTEQMEKHSDNDASNVSINENNNSSNNNKHSNASELVQNKEEQVENEGRHKHRKRRHHHHHHHHDDDQRHDDEERIKEEEEKEKEEEDNKEHDRKETNNESVVNTNGEHINTDALSSEISDTASPTKPIVPSILPVPPLLEDNSQLSDKSDSYHKNNNEESKEKGNNANAVNNSNSSVDNESNASHNEEANPSIRAAKKKEEDLLYLMQVYDSQTLVQDLLKFLRTGTQMLKHGRQGKPHNRLFWIATANNKRELFWIKPDGANNSNNERSSINLSDVHYIQLGCFSKVFKRNPITSLDPAFFRCFSLGLRGTDRTVDVVADSVADFEAWVVGLAHLIGVDPAWGGKLDVTKDPTFTHLTFFESSLCESNYIQPRDYLMLKKTVQQRAAYTARVLSECGNDAKKAFGVLGGIHLPAIDSKGALYMTKGELRFLIPQLSLDIFRITQIWILFQQMNLVYDDKFVPATAFGFTLR